LTQATSRIEEVASIIEAHPRLLVITGAGCSEPSGIPTYRDDEAEWQRTAPIQHQDFVRKPESRQRYWARSYAGWPPVRDARPNHAHEKLASLEQHDIVHHLVTQNVDGLHQKAGHQRVTELHGTLSTVICLDCGNLRSRDEMQERLHAANPDLNPSVRALAPDGDAEVHESIVANLTIPECERCGGTLKPHVVFYGGSVPKPVVQSIYDRLNEVEAVLAVGTSLMVFSAFRFVRRAAELGKPVALVNRGRTRADELASIKFDGDCEEAMQNLIDRLALEAP
jgi:NAD-dependent SIR2 family protein deacetylase